MNRIVGLTSALFLSLPLSICAVGCIAGGPVAELESEEAIAVEEEALVGLDDEQVMLGENGVGAGKRPGDNQRSTWYTDFWLSNPSGVSRKLNIGVYNVQGELFRSVEVVSPSLGIVSCAQYPDRWYCGNIDLGACSTYRGSSAVHIRVGHAQYANPQVNYSFYGDELCPQ